MIPFGPGRFLDEPSSGGGGGSRSPFGAGVEFDSEALSPEELVVVARSAAGVDADEEEALFALEFLRESGFNSKRLSIDGDSLRVTVLDCFFEDLSDRPFVVGVVMAGEAGVDMVGDGG